MAVWKELKTERDYKKALRRIEDLLDAKRNDAEQNEFLLLSLLIAQYEEEVHPLPDASPAEVIRFVMKMRGMRQKDLVPVLGSKGQVSRILNGSRKLTTDKILALSTFLGIPADALLPEGRVAVVSAGMS